MFDGQGKGLQSIPPPPVTSESCYINYSSPGFVIINSFCIFAEKVKVYGKDQE